MFIRLIVLSTMLISAVFSNDTITIGVLAYRSKAATLEEWGSTATYLHQMQPKYTFTIVPLTIPELNDAVRHNMLNLVITNSGHFIYLEDKYHIARIATVKRYNHGQWCDQFGGVIFTRMDRFDIQNLSDLQDKTISAVDEKSFGGYATELYELLSYGINANNLNVRFVGMPHEKVPQEVIHRKVDVGFVRTGILESMSEKGLLDLHQIKILHPKKVKDFPYLLSTALYPEWSISRTTLTSQDFSNQIAIALLQEFLHKKPIEGSIGWSSPLEYYKANTIFRTLHLPPYDHPEVFTLKDIWKEYHLPLISLLFVSIVLVLVASWMYRKNSQEKAYIQSILDASRNFMVVTNGEILISANQAMLTFLGYNTLDEFKRTQKCVSDFFEEGDSDEYLQTTMNTQAWVKYMIAHPEKEYKAKMTINGKTNIFQVNAYPIAKVKPFQALSIFSNISSMYHQLTIDPLTKIANRLHFDVLFHHTVQLSLRNKQPLSIIFFDIDHFKHINDTFGHLAGDEVLIDLAQLIKNLLRRSDVLARWGGEEFIILLSNTPLHAAISIAENLRKKIAHNSFGTIGHITSSFGVSELQEGETKEELLQRVDELLYHAKEHGRNKVISALV